MRVPEPVEYAAWVLLGWLWAPWQWLRHPRRNWCRYRKWQCRPVVGAWVEDCRGRVCKVTALGETEDDLLFEDGSSASWMNCCDLARAPGG